MSDYIVTLNDIDDIRVLLRPVQGIQVGDDTTYLFDPALMEAYVELARRWAIGTIVEQPLGSSKYWAEQAAASAISINPSNLVHISGDETITGVKTFSTSPIVPTPSNDNEAATKKYVDDNASIIDPSDFVHISGDQTIAGVKTFSSSPIVPTPTTDYQAATKKYVDDNTAGLADKDLSNLTTVGKNQLCPIATIIANPVSSVPDGYLYCDGSEISRTSYADLFTAIGTLYGAGDGSTTFNLPDYRGCFLRGYDATRSAAVGTSQADGLPNITGVTESAVWSGQQYSGAFKQQSRSTHSAKGSSSLTFDIVDFDASLSNSIYGNSNYVTPLNHAIYYFIKY